MFARYRKQGITLNAARFVGHGPARTEVMGNDFARQATPAEVDRMKAYIRKGMDEGALGFSTGLAYGPGYYSSTDEVIALNRVAAEYGGIYDTHDRDIGVSSKGIGFLNSVDGLLFSGSAFGPCIDAVARQFAPLPVLKPNEAMIAEAVSAGGRVGLVATFAPTLASMRPEFPPEMDVRVALADGGLAALQAGDGARHDTLVTTAARRLVKETGCTTIALAQFSMARAAGMVATAVGRPVLTPVASAVRAIRARCLASSPPLHS